MPLEQKSSFANARWGTTYRLIISEMIRLFSTQIIQTKSKREYTLNSNARGHIIHGNKSLTMEGMMKIIT